MFMLSMQAGLITVEPKFWLSELHTDPAGLGAKLAQQKPYFTPGTFSYYSWFLDTKFSGTLCFWTCYVFGVSRFK